MAHTHYRVLVHIVFNTKGRRELITPELRAHLWPYMGGIIRNLDATALAINGVADHVHLLVSLPRKLSIAELVGKVKANSSKWINEDAKWGLFAWQQGYSVFSVSHSQEGAVREYIANQEEHHRKTTFAEEVIALLEKHQIQYDPRFVVERQSLAAPRLSFLTLPCTPCCARGYLMSPLRGWQVNVSIS